VINLMHFCSRERPTVFLKETAAFRLRSTLMKDHV